MTATCSSKKVDLRAGPRWEKEEAQMLRPTEPGLTDRCGVCLAGSHMADKFFLQILERLDEAQARWFVARERRRASDLTIRQR